ncbi:hypothetical protein BJ166DRAFT_525669 [Pestalotiopsis sp. NC0098]|nr:hypothetical protein BJ166DRAFT_525669 [Pestalotiopsis sp. NC0098]
MSGTWQRPDRQPEALSPTLMVSSLAAIISLEMVHQSAECRPLSSLNIGFCIRRAAVIVTKESVPLHNGSTTGLSATCEVNASTIIGTRHIYGAAPISSNYYTLLSRSSQLSGQTRYSHYWRLSMARRRILDCPESLSWLDQYRSSLDEANKGPSPPSSPSSPSSRSCIRTPYNIVAYIHYIHTFIPPP